MKMPNGVKKKRQATDNRIRNAPLENIPALKRLDIAFNLQDMDLFKILFMAVSVKRSFQLLHLWFGLLFSVRIEQI